MLYILLLFYFISSRKCLRILAVQLTIDVLQVIDVTAKQCTVDSLTEAYIPCALEEKDAHLYCFLQRHPGRTLVFCNSVSCVRRLAQLFTLLKCKPQALHAQMAQKQRLRSLDRFSADSKGLLLATDVAARGLDIPNVQHVIHYQVPRTSEVTTAGVELGVKLAANKKFKYSFSLQIKGLFTDHRYF